MSGLLLAFLVIQGVLFAAWTFLMFRSLFGIQRRYRAETGKAFIGPIAVFAVYSAYLKNPTFRSERSAILVLLGLLIVETLLSVLAISRQA